MKRLIFLFATIAISGEEKSPFTAVERLAVASLQQRQSELQRDIQLFTGEVCKSRNLAMEECNIDTQNMTVSKIIKKEETKK